MSVDSPPNGPHQPERLPSWYHDKEQVEHVVMMLEETVKDVETGKVLPKYSIGYIFHVAFPDQVEMPWTTKYVGARSPSSAISFDTSVRNLTDGKYPFGPNIPIGLQDRFLTAMRLRGENKGEYWSTRWPRPKKLVLAGLIEYCGVSYKEAQKVMEHSFNQHLSIGSLERVLSSSRKDKKFPYDTAESLRSNMPLAAAFVGYLRALTGMTLPAVRKLIEESDIPATDAQSREERLKKFDEFVKSYEEYRAKHLPQS